MSPTPDTSPHRKYNRDEDLKPPASDGQPPRPATEPEGSEGSARNDRTATDPATGEPQRRRN